MEYKKFKRLEIIGIFVCYILAILLHFLYKWINGNVWGIIFGSVNESVWEHIKLFTMPYLFWAFIELAIVRIPLKKFVVSKVIGVYFIIFSIITYFYTYTFFTGKAIMIVDIICSLVCLMLSFFASYKLIISELNMEKWYSAALCALTLFVIMYLSFTIYPPKIDLFKDPVTNSYGLSFNTYKQAMKYFGGIYAINP